MDNRKKIVIVSVGIVLLAAVVVISVWAGHGTGQTENTKGEQSGQSF